MSGELVIALVWLVLSVLLDLIANWSLKKSEGFTNKIWGFGAIGFISIAFACMGKTLHVLPLSITYALWSVLGIIGTLCIGKFVFKQQLSPQKYAAVAVLAVGIVMMNLA